MKYDDAMRLYGSDKPDLRFDMVFVELNDLVKNKGFSVFDDVGVGVIDIVGVCVLVGDGDGAGVCVDVGVCDGSGVCVDV